jgi:predicted nucleic acid-binding protein
MDIVHVDGLDELTELVDWLEVLGSGEHNRGEATVCAWASINAATVVMDDAEAVRVARERGLQVLRTLGICAHAVKRGVETLAAASAMLDAMMVDGARYPFRPGGFPDWYEKNPPS